MIAITRNRLVEMLKDVIGSTFITFTAETTPKMNKTNNPYFGKVTKVAVVNGNVCFDYQKGVERRLEKEGKDKGDWTPGKSWHVPVMNGDSVTPLCVSEKDPNKFYIRFSLVNAIQAEYRLEDGTILPKSSIEPYLPAKSDYSNQNLSEENTLKIMTYGIDSIRTIRMNGETYVVS